MDYYMFYIIKCPCSVWGPPLTAEDFLNAKKVQDMSITEETRQAIRAGIESESQHRGELGVRVFT
jgi:hypothetical protein